MRAGNAVGKGPLWLLLTERVAEGTSKTQWGRTGANGGGELLPKEVSMVERNIERERKRQSELYRTKIF